MRIAYLTNQYPYVRHTFIRREILALEAQGVEVFRFSIRDSGHDSVDPADQAEKPKTVSLLAFGLPRLLLALMLTFFTRPWKWFPAFFKAVRLGHRNRSILKHIIYLAEACLLRKKLRQAGATHLHIHFATNPATVGLLCERLGGPPFSITIHGPEEWDRPESLSLREKYEAARLVVAVSDFGRCQVYRWTGVEHWPKVKVIRCGIDDSFLNAETTPVPETNRLVLVAGLTEQKGHLLLLDALQIVHERGLDFEMLFIGDGPLRPEIEKRLQQKQLSSKVKLLGWKSNAEVRDFLNQSRALIMPSLAENLPVAMMESLALARPVLGTYIAGVPELIEHGVSGWLVPAGNAERSADAIETILKTPVSQLSEMGQRGREKVRRMHDAHVEAGKLKRLFLGEFE
jgi:glycosyltransferase involved in cell wall biosynthesis